jgi:hypothetical protein
MKQANPPPVPPAPITFQIGIMLPPTTPGEMSRLYPAGTATPWTNVSDVPPNLREFIGTPPEPNFDVEAFRRETKTIQSALEPESETVRAALQNIDDEAYRAAKSRAEAVIHNETPRGTYDRTEIEKLH